jgi:1-acyl-sn-glycerol-3-phosphate acyltransferase
MQLLRSIVFTTLFFLMTAVYAVMVLTVGVCTPYPRRFFIAKLWADTLLWLLEKICGLGYRVTGKDNLPAGAHIAMWKHSSSWETVAQATICPPQAWVLKQELMWIPLLGWAMHFMKPIAIDRRAGTAAVNRVVAQGKQRLENGVWIVIFPEGTRMPAGETRKYGVSGALLASRTGCKVIPVAHNAGKFWPRRGWVKKKGVIQVVIGPPIESAGRDPREINADVQNWIESTLKSFD